MPSRSPFHGLRGLSRELGNPPWYAWPFIALSLGVSSYFFVQAVLMLVCGIVCLVFGKWIIGVIALAVAAVASAKFLADLNKTYQDDPT